MKPRPHSWLVALAAALLVVALGVAQGAEEPKSWDGLQKVKSKRLDAVYLLPGVDFKTYTSVMMQPAEVALHEDWLRDINRDRIASQRVTSEDVQKMREDVAAVLPKVMAEEFEKAGWKVVTTPEPGTLSLATAIIDIHVNAPDTMSAGRSRTYTVEAGNATLLMEVRDAVTGQLLGRAVDARETRNMGTLQWTNSATNRADFTSLFRDWGRICVKGLNTLKESAQVVASD
jgi:hypothetical protein